MAARNPERMMDRMPGWELGLHLTGQRAMGR